MTNIKAFILLVVSCCLLVSISGCSPMALSEEQKRVLLAADPDFKSALEQKETLDSRLAELRAQFLSEKNICESRLAALRQELEAKKAQFYAKAQEIKVQLEPERRKLTADIAVVSEEFRNKLKNQKAVNGMLQQAKAITEGKFSANLSEQDKVEWQKRFDSLTEESNKLNQEIISIKEKLYILKLKLRSLIQ